MNKLLKLRQGQTIYRLDEDVMATFNECTPKPHIYKLRVCSNNVALPNAGQIITDFPLWYLQYLIGTHGTNNLFFSRRKAETALKSLTVQVAKNNTKGTTMKEVVKSNLRLVKARYLKSDKYVATMGLRNATKEEILDIKVALEELNIPYVHRSKDLKFNGVIVMGNFKNRKAASTRPYGHTVKQQKSNAKLVSS